MQPNDELPFSLTCPWQKRQLTQTGDQIHCEGWSELGWTESKKKRLMWKRRILLCSKWVYLIRSKQTPPENIDGKNIIFKLSEPCNQFGKSKWWWQYMRPLLNHMSVYRHRNPFMPPKICTFFGFSYGWRAAFSPSSALYIGNFCSSAIGSFVTCNKKTMALWKKGQHCLNRLQSNHIWNYKVDWEIGIIQWRSSVISNERKKSFYICAFRPKWYCELCHLLLFFRLSILFRVFCVTSPFADGNTKNVSSFG